ncbi:L-rhamnose/proton symporter RhaT [Occallatibacter savannae]|uniref:L-rhamnose/proton symporter RhaT n=1 Tax=Occallatibacter savannae TaxID=1002691 RepID=UPI000D696140|nr:L-rhamnose/proton symporter RhaT [Occallatibacter savannae]
MTSVVAGIGWHIVGASMAASFYAPIERVRKWSWETTWALAGLFSWVLLPIGVSLVLLPRFFSFYSSQSASLLLTVAAFGAMWGVGNVSYGLTMRYLGMSLGIGVAIGVTLIVGTLVPPVMHGQAAALFTTRSGLITMSGVLVALIGVAIVSWAGHQKEVQLKGHLQEFNVGLGLLLAVLCGIFSSGMSFAIDAAQPMEAAAKSLGVNPLYAALPSYVIIMGGGAVINFAYCFIRLAVLPRLSLRSDLNQDSPTLMKNAALASTGGIMWYLQFFFYAWGAANIPPDRAYVNWMLHMSIYVLCGGLVGLVLGEWAGVRKQSVRLLLAGVGIIIAAANLVGLGMKAS